MCLLRLEFPDGHLGDLLDDLDRCGDRQKSDREELRDPYDGMSD